MKELRNEIKKSLIRLEEKERYTDLCMKAWDDDLTNEDRDQAYDKAYENEYLEYEHLANLIHQFANVTFEVARELVRNEKEKIIVMFCN